MKKFDEMRKSERFRSLAKIASCMVITLLLTTGGVAKAQDAAATPNQQVTTDGFIVHQSVELGGHYVDTKGSGEMYDTLLNLHSGPRVLGETFTMKAAPGTKHNLVDTLSAISDGFGGDPINYTRMTFSKGKVYEFAGTFRRDRQYSNYDLLGNALLNPNLSIAIGTPNLQTTTSTQPTSLTGIGVGSLGSFAWQTQQNSPEKYNTVRHMLDTDVTIFPLSKLTFREGYSENIFQGPSNWPLYATGVAKTTMLGQQNVRISTDIFRSAIDYKPFAGTKLTLETEITHLKNNTWDQIDPSAFNVQEANGQKVALGMFNSGEPAVSTSATTNSLITGELASTNGVTTPGRYYWFYNNIYNQASDCNLSSMANQAVMLTAAGSSNPSGLPTIDPACDVIQNLTRTMPTRSFYPTEMFKLQSNSIKNITMNGIFRYTEGRTNMPNLTESFQGLNGAVRAEVLTDWARAKRRDVGVDYSITWQALKKLSFSDSISLKQAAEPGWYNTTNIKYSTATTTGSETLNAPVLAPVTTAYAASPSTGYYGQRILTNNLVAAYEISPRATTSITWRHGTNSIVYLLATNAPTLITEDAGIWALDLRPTDKWTINGSVEASYDNNVFTALEPREMQRYRMHTRYKINNWATATLSYSERDRYNNTNNTGTASAVGPLQHVDQSRYIGGALAMYPNEHYGVDLNYAYSYVYTSTNANFDANGNLGANCPGTTTPGGIWCATDWMSAPTNFTSVSFFISPNKHFKSNLGYRLSDVSGKQIQYNPLQVNGSLNSAYSSPYINATWITNAKVEWKADYHFYDYGEGGPVGPTAPRNARANVVTVAMKYAF